MPQIPRRSFLTASFGSLTMVVPGTLRAAPLTRRPAPMPLSVSVDVNRLLALGLGSTAELIGSTMTAELQSGFADRLGGQRLVVRLTRLSLGAYVGGGGGGGGGGETDYLEGEALLIGPEGRTIARYPQLLALPSSSAGAWYRPDAEQRRIVMLARYYAQWLQKNDQIGRSRQLPR